MIYVKIKNSTKKQPKKAKKTTIKISTPQK